MRFWRHGEGSIKNGLRNLGRKVETVYRKDNGEAKPKIGENTERGVEMEEDKHAVHAVGPGRG